MDFGCIVHFALIQLNFAVCKVSDGSLRFLYNIMLDVDLEECLCTPQFTNLA